MARNIVVRLGDDESAYAFKKVDRSKLYGRRTRMALDPAGQRCVRGSLTSDGSLVLRSGMTAQGYFDPGGVWWPSKELVGIDADGAEIDKVRGTLGVPCDLQGPVDPRDLLDLKVQAVYALEPDGEVNDELTAALDAGGIYRFSFSYRGGYRLDEAYLIANDTGVYAIVGQSADPEWCALEQPVTSDQLDEGDDLDDDFDFEMF